MSGISVVTATYNAAANIGGLIESLLAQSDTDFEWVVIDGGSSDATLELVRERTAGLRCTVVSEPDFGIYDALNKGVRAAAGDYYLVLGADDRLHKDAVRKFRQALGTDPADMPDIVTARVLAGDSVIAPRPGKAWLYGLQGHVSSHSVGCLIRKALHTTHGYYSRRFPIAADQYFIKTAVREGASVRIADFIAGEYGSGGLSSTDVAGTLSEIFRVQMLTEKERLLQILLYLARLLKNYRRL